MEWTQQEDDLWTLVGPGGADPGQTLGVARLRDGAWWGELQPRTAGAGSLEEPATLDEEQFQESLANLPEPLGPFASADEARAAVEQAVQQA